jgi:hypothetical protein
MAFPVLGDLRRGVESVIAGEHSRGSRPLEGIWRAFGAAGQGRQGRERGASTPAGLVASAALALLGLTLLGVMGVRELEKYRRVQMSLSAPYP